MLPAAARDPEKGTAVIETEMATLHRKLLYEPVHNHGHSGNRHVSEPAHLRAYKAVANRAGTAIVLGEAVTNW